jgi:Ca2+-binding RTX toxin-like protein
MRNLLMMILSTAAVGGLTFGATAVLADDGQSSDDNVTCTAGASTGTGGEGNSDRAVAARRDGGTQGDDHESGTGRGDHMDGQGGDDTLEGNAGDDVICGAAGDDRLQGGQGDDKLSGGAGDDAENGNSGNDTEFGDGGNDHLAGNAGNDTLVGGPGHDRLSGGAGRDLIVSRDGVRDVVLCGAGTDTVRADASDIVAKSCEHVSR